MVLLIKQNISAMISGLSWEPNHKVGPNFNEKVCSEFPATSLHTHIQNPTHLKGEGCSFSVRLTLAQRYHKCREESKQAEEYGGQAVLHFYLDGIPDPSSRVPGNVLGLAQRIL